MEALLLLLLLRLRRGAVEGGGAVVWFERDGGGALLCDGLGLGAGDRGVGARVKERDLLGVVLGSRICAGAASASAG
ncbi:hypothetical protein F5X97DRAFT_289683 [Nemania serpens]|nr:hypothetical protein F5X97DRAFT_289683 [Nemania serpens]